MMGFRLKRKHMIDFLFPIALFFVFALSALALILLAAGIYQSTTENSSFQYTSRTGLAYISEKIHQNDENGAVYLDSFDGCNALVLEQNYEEEKYCTYIYAHEGELKELFIKDGVEAGAEDGKTILEVQDFTMEQISDNLFSVCVYGCRDADEFDRDRDQEQIEYNSSAFDVSVTTEYQWKETLWDRTMRVSVPGSVKKGQ